MNKKIKTTDTDVRVATSTIDVVEIGGLSFEHDERYPWVDVYHIGNENKEFVEQIDGADMPTIVDIEDLKILSSNWYSNNVEVVKNIETAPEVPVQEQQDNIYPSKITLVDVIGSGTYVSNGIIYDSSTALTIEVLIDRNIYNKKDVYKAIKKVYGKLLQYFC